MRILDVRDNKGSRQRFAAKICPVAVVSVAYLDGDYALIKPSQTAAGGPSSAIYPFRTSFFQTFGAIDRLRMGLFKNRARNRSIVQESL